MRLPALLVACVCLTRVGLAVESSTTGYLDARMQGASVRTDAFMPADLSPSLSTVIEGNVQLKLRFGDRGFLNADASLFWQDAGLFYGQDPTGARVQLDARDVPAFRPGMVVSELYGSWNLHEHAHLTVGKTRVVWGPGLALNPTDLINPGKDPSDPASQRVGAWLARLELPFERFTVSTLFAAKALRTYGGLPSALLYYPDHPSDEAARGHVPDDRDTLPHFVAAARVYALVADTDLNLIYAFSNLFNDAFDHKHRVGLTASRVIVGGLALHGEAMFQRGSSRLYFDPQCAASSEALAACARDGKEAAARSRLDDTDLRVKALAGARYMFESSAMLSLEYSFNGEGYTEEEFAAFLQGVSSARRLATQQPGVGEHLASLLGTSSSDPGSPQKLTFDPMRRHYLIATAQQPFVWDDFTFGAALMLGLADLSGMFIPSVAWSAREWLTLGASAYLPVPSPGSLGTDVGGETFTEFGLQPNDWRVLVTARAWF